MTTEKHEEVPRRLSKGSAAVSLDSVEEGGFFRFGGMVDVWEGMTIAILGKYLR
jgi:hypothetical protein